MGYLTYYNIAKISGSDEDYDNLLKDLEQKNGAKFSGESLEAKWYENDKDCLELSKKYPELTFQLAGDGEDSYDKWCTRYKNGKSETIRVEMPDFIEFATEKERRKTINDIETTCEQKIRQMVKAILNERGGKAEINITIEATPVQTTTVKEIHIENAPDGCEYIVLKNEYTYSETAHIQKEQMEAPFHRLGLESMFKIAKALLE